MYYRCSSCLFIRLSFPLSVQKGICYCRQINEGNLQFEMFFFPYHSYVEIWFLWLNKSIWYLLIHFRSSFQVSVTFWTRRVKLIFRRIRSGLRNNPLSDGMWYSVYAPFIIHAPGYHWREIKDFWYLYLPNLCTHHEGNYPNKGLEKPYQPGGYPSDFY